MKPLVEMRSPEGRTFITFHPEWHTNCVVVGPREPDEEPNILSAAKAGHLEPPTEDWLPPDADFFAALLDEYGPAVARELRHRFICECERVDSTIEKTPSGSNRIMFRGSLY